MSDLYVRNDDPSITIPVTGPRVEEGSDLPVHGWLRDATGAFNPCVIIDSILIVLRPPAEDG